MAQLCNPVMGRACHISVQGDCVKLQKIYDIDKQSVAYFLNIPNYNAWNNDCCNS